MARRSATVPLSNRDSLDPNDMPLNPSTRLLRSHLVDQDMRLKFVEETCSDIHRLTKWFKWIGPAVIGAAVSAGLINGQWGAFFRALFTGQ